MSQAREAAERVEAFLNARAQMRGPVDHAVVFELMVGGEQFELREDDLRTLVGAGRLLRPALTLGLPDESA
jgi:hypothetical protein